MEGVLSIFQSISSLNKNYLAIYLQGLYDHKSFGADQAVTKNVIQIINSLLVKANSRGLGIELLSEFLNQCSVEVFENHAQLWTSCTIKALNLQDIKHSANSTFIALSKISGRAKQSNDFSKIFAHTYLIKIYDAFEFLHEGNSYEALNCLEICLKNFPGPSGSSRGKLEKFLWSHIDTADTHLAECCAKCLHLVLQVGGGGNHNSAFKNQWSMMQTKLLGTLHILMNEMFAKCREIYDFVAETEKLEQLPVISLSAEPIERQAQLYARFHNLIIFFEIALSEPFPGEKPVMLKRILNLISRGLNVTLNVVSRNPISDNLALGILLPKMHRDLLQLLRILLLCMGSHMKMFHTTVLGLLDDVLKWTSTSQASTQKPFAETRIKAYEIIVLWCSIMQNGSCCDIIAEHLIKEIILDIMPVQNDFVLKVQNGTEKNISKKMRKLAHKAQNLQSNIGQTHSPGIAKKSEIAPDEKRILLCVAALRCLQKILFTTGHMLKPGTVNFIQKNILQIANTFYDLRLNKHELYYNWICRYEIYNVLYAMQTTLHQLCPPPTVLIIDMLTKAHQMDNVIKIRQHCGDMLLQLEKIIHPQKEGLMFPLDVRSLRSELVARDNSLSYDMTEQSILEAEDNAEEEEEVYEDPQLSEQLSKETSDASILDDIIAKNSDNSNDIEAELVVHSNGLTVNESKNNLDLADEDTVCDDESFSKQCHLEVNLSKTADEKAQNNETDILAPPSAKRVKTSEKDLDAKVLTKIEPLSKEDLDNDKLLADLESVFVDEFI